MGVPGETYSPGSMFCESTTPFSGETSRVFSTWVSANATAARAWSARARPWATSSARGPACTSLKRSAASTVRASATLSWPWEASSSRSALASLPRSSCWRVKSSRSRSRSASTLCRVASAAAISCGREPACNAAKAASAPASSAQGELLLLLRVVQPGHQLTGLDAVAFGNEPFDDAARYFEAELGVGHLDVAGEHQFTGTGTIAVGTGAQEQQDGKQGGGREPGTLLEAGGARPEIRREDVFHRRRGVCRSLSGRRAKAVRRRRDGRHARAFAGA